MKKLLNYFIIIGLCFILSLNTNNDYATKIINLLVLTIMLCSLLLIKSKYFTYFIYLVYLFLIYLEPLFVYYLPIIILFYDNNYLALILGFSIIITINYLDALSILLLSYLLLVFNRYYLQKETNEAKYLDTIDTLRLSNTKLIKDNQEIIKVQQELIDISNQQQQEQIARDIHDNVGHLLSSSLLQIKALSTINIDNTIDKYLINLEASLNQAMDATRAQVHNISNSSFDLEDSISKLLKEQTTFQTKLIYQINNDLSLAYKHNILLIIKEAINNTIKHSNATKINISLKEFNDFYYLYLADNGTSLQDNNIGIGLVNIERRVMAMNGNVTFNNDNGFVIKIHIYKQGETHD